MPDSKSGSAGEIFKVITDMFSAFENHNIQEIEAALAEDCTVWDVFQPDLIRGREERVKFHEGDQEQMQARGDLTMSISEPVIDIWGDTALVRYVLSFDYTPPNPTSGQVRITDVLRSTNGRWRIIHHHEGMMPSGVPPITN
jgi:ketosteroid isomerase-like protein